MAHRSYRINRRDFVAQLAAGVVLAPFARLAGPRRLRAATAAATAAPKRLVVVVSLGTDKDLWLPSKSATGALQLPTMLQPLSAIADDMVMLDGLSFPFPAEGHSTPQTLTGYGNNHDGVTATSVDQYVAAKVGGSQRLASLSLGFQAKSEAQFWRAGQRLTTLDSPSDAWQSAFGGVSVAGASQAGASQGGASSVDAARTRVWQMVQKQAEQMAAGLSGDAKTRVLDHASSVGQLLTRGSATSLGANCAVPAQPTLGSPDADADAQQETVSAAHSDLIAAALACDVTRVVGMQFGTSNKQYMSSVNVEEHGMIHSGDYGKPSVIQAEVATCNWLVKLVQTLKGLPDPLADGSSMLDNTLILWTRDMGHAPTHMQYSLPYVLVGGGSYLKKQAGGSYANVGGGDDATASVGLPHQRLLLNAIEYMGAGAGADFGTVRTLAAGDRAPLPQIKA